MTVTRMATPRGPIPVTFDTWGFPIIRGTILGVPIIRTRVFWGLYGVPLFRETTTVEALAGAGWGGMPWGRGGGNAERRRICKGLGSKLLKVEGIAQGTTITIIKGDTRSLDYSSNLGP